MAINHDKLRNSKQLIQDIEDLVEKKQDILNCNDDVILKMVIDIDDIVDTISTNILVEMQEITEAYRVTLAQLINKEIDHKANLLDKIKLKSNEKNQ